MSKTKERKIRGPMHSIAEWYLSDSTWNHYYLSHKSKKQIGINLHIDDIAKYLNNTDIKEIQIVIDPGEDHSQLYKELRKYKGKVWY